MGKSLKSQESGSRILGEYRLTDISLSLGDLSGLSQISSILVRYLGGHGIAGDQAVSGGKSWGLDQAPALSAVLCFGFQMALSRELARLEED